MCGIAGIFAYHASATPVDGSELDRMRESMVRRGPDGAGTWISDEGRAGFAHRRLSIIDLSDAGAQPMTSSDGRFKIVFNGEIYNYRALRQALQQRGCTFSSDSDTEVLLHLYAERGVDMVHALRGMYAFAIYDGREQSLLLARDPFGIKPLYYSDDGATLRFASQVKALVAGGEAGKGLSAAGLVGFCLWGHVPEPHTIFSDVRALAPGSTMLLNKGGRPAISTFFSVRDEIAAAADRAPESPQQARERLHAALRASVRDHMVADVPVGVFLSSGLDSSVLTALASETCEDSELRAVTLAFDEYQGTDQDEVPLASLVARRYGAHHAIDRISHRDFEAHFDDLLLAMDQPTIDGVNTYFVSRAAARSGLKVALSGLGGDELFGGYPSFAQVPAMARLARIGGAVPGLGKGFRIVSAALLGRYTSPKYAGVFEYGGTYGGAYLLRRGLFMPWELPRVLDRDVVRDGWAELQPLARLDATASGLQSDFQRVSALETCWYMRNQLLRDSDWAGMAHSLEIRVPLVDVELFRAAAPSMAREPLRKLHMAGAPAKALPDEILARRKTGFSIPVQKWLGSAPGAAERGLRGWSRRLLALYGACA